MSALMDGNKCIRACLLGWMDGPTCTTIDRPGLLVPSCLGRSVSRAGKLSWKSGSVKRFLVYIGDVDFVIVHVINCFCPSVNLFDIPDDRFLPKKHCTHLLDNHEKTLCT